MFKRKDIFVLIIVGIALGILIVRQFYVAKVVQKVTKGDEEQLMALEIAQLLKANTDLRLEIKDSGTTSEKYQQALGDRKSAIDEVAKNLGKYKIIAGATKIKGPGVEIRIDGDLAPEQLVDLVNALRNIGIEGLSVNGKRFIISSYFKITASGVFVNETKIDKPFVTQVIGNAPLIKEALLRKGGIIEQIQSSGSNIKIEINEKDAIVLEKY